MDAATVHRRRWLILAVLSVSVFLVVVDNTIVNVALPTLNRELGASVSELQWIVDAYSLVFAGLLLAAGGLGDRLGRKGAMQVGLVIFGITSALGAFATSSGQLIAARGAMGIGAALVFPATLAILTNVFTDPTERAKAIGAWSAVSGLAVAFGPITGGFLLEHFWWGSVFLVNVPIVIVALVAGALLVPTSRDPEVGRFDVLGMLLSISAIGLLVFTVIEGPRWGWTSTTTALGFAGAVVLLAAFVALGAPGRQAAARRPHLQGRPVQCGGRGHRHGVLRPVRLHLPGDPVLPVREGLLDAVGRPAHPAVRHLRRHHRTDRRPVRPALGAPSGGQQRPAAR